ncbi:MULTISPECIES: hypothetical protein [unclassified Streptomyces]|nr:MULTISPECIES: hypothetical protein [unclassified Streptomyces]MYX38061.1 hypothetical protein [Streptomyces sp. SID8377]
MTLSTKVVAVGQPPAANVAAWALASTCRGDDLPYGPYGTAVVIEPS